jgi:hypothetical protein
MRCIRPQTAFPQESIRYARRLGGFFLKRSEFLAWINSTGVRYKAFDRLASALESLLLNHLLIGGSEISLVESCTRFANAVPIVFSDCDYAIYEDPFVAEAYAFVHLLERYHRARTILEILKSH